MGLRLATGAFRFSPIPSILNIANIPPLDLNITQNYILQKAKRAQNNITMHTIKLNNFEFDCSGIFKHEHSITPPWVMELRFNTDLSLKRLWTLLLKIWLTNYLKTTRVSLSSTPTDKRLKQG